MEPSVCKSEKLKDEKGKLMRFAEDSKMSEKPSGTQSKAQKEEIEGIIVPRIGVNIYETVVEPTR